MNKNESNLGPYLKTARERKSLTLRAAEEVTGVSNAYLSQLESGKVRQPSPIILHKLSELYEIPYSDLMQHAGYPLPGKDNDSGYQKSRKSLRFQDVTPDEADALQEYLDFIRMKRDRGQK